MIGSIVTTEFVIAILSITSFVVAVLGLLISYSKKESSLKNRDRYDFEIHRVELDFMRKNLEMQLYEASKKLEESERRWKDMNHLVVSTQSRQDKNDNLPSQVVPSVFLKNFGIESQKDFDIDFRQVFLLTPFNPIYLKTFDTVRNVCSGLGLRCIRGDEEFISSEIFPEIIKQILKSRFIIANITGRNPNVLYELGIAHALGKPTIIISENFADIPFDLNTKRILIFESQEDLMSKLSLTINDMLIHVIQ